MPRTKPETHETRTYLTRDDGVNDCSSVANHENKLGIWKQCLEIDGGSEGERILVTEAFGWRPVFRDDLQNEGRDRRVQDFGRNACFFQSSGLKWRSHPLLPESQHPGNDPRLLTTPDVRMSIEQNSEQSRSAARHSSDENNRRTSVVREPHVFPVLVRNNKTLGPNELERGFCMKDTYLRTDVLRDPRLREAGRTVVLIKEADQ